MMTSLKILTYVAVAEYAISFWALIFFPNWLYWLAAAVGIAMMCLGGWLINQEQTDHYEYRP